MMDSRSSRNSLNLLWILRADRCKISIAIIAMCTRDAVTGNGYNYRCSLVPRLPLSFSPFFCTREYYTQKIEGEGEPGMELCPPVATLASHGYGLYTHGHVLNCAQYRSCAALWIVTHDSLTKMHNVKPLIT
jgi:hypothetical protein